MNIVNTLTLRHIKTHKKRSILTILAIIVSVAMVTAVFTSALSFVNYFKNVSLAIDGSWHSYVATSDFYANREKFETQDIEKYGIELDYGAGTVSQSNKKIEVSINACDKSFLDLRNVRISEGKMPQSANELLVHKKFLDKNKLNWNVGDKVTFPVEYASPNGNYHKDTTFIVAGITDSNVAETDFVDAFVYATRELVESAPSVSVYIKYADLTNKVYENTKTLSQQVNDEAVSGYNLSLLTYSGITTDDETLYIIASFCAIVLLIIAIVSIFMIYDSFAVSYQERARYLGMLASVGATKKQKRASIYFEGLILGLIGIPLGIIAGIGGIWLTFKGISGVWLDTLGVEYDKALTVSVNWWVILATVLASAVTIFVSSYIPALKASKTTAIDAIRQANTVKVKKAKKLKTSKLATKLLGYEGALAVKNFKRNGRRSKTVVFALFMSVVVFLSVANFSLMFSDLMKDSYNQSADIMVSVPYRDAQKLDDVLNARADVESQFGIDYEYADFDESLIRDDAKRLFTNSSVILAFVDNATLDSYLKQLGENPAKYHDKKHPTAILHNVALTRDDKKKVKVQPLVDMTGKKLDVKLSAFGDELEAEAQTVSIDPVIGIQTTVDYKNDMFFYQDMHLPLLLMSIDLQQQYYGKNENISTYYTASITCEDAGLLQEELEGNVLNDAGIEAFSIDNASSQMKAVNNILTIVKVFVFGFIALITLISIMNIINTISNSMNERRREFAMIRSVGMTPKSFRKMIYYESFRYGLISLLWSVPISIGIHFVLFKVLANSYNYGFVLHPLVYIAAIVAVFIIIGIAIIYSTSKIKNDNIIETLKLDIN